MQRGRARTAATRAAAVATLSSLSILFSGFAWVPPAAALPKIVTVCPSGCDFTSVNAAANDPGTNAGDSIDVMPATYTGQVTVSKQLDIFGAGGGPRPVITSAAANAQTFEITAGGAGTTITHLDISGTGTNTIALSANGAVNGSDLALSATDSCAELFSATPSQLGPDVTATNSGDQPCIFGGLPSLTGLTVTSPDGGGVDLTGGTLTDSTVDANFALLSGNEITVRRTTLNGRTVGADTYFLGGEPALISDTVVTASAGPAVYAEAGSGSGADTLTLRNVTAYASGSGSAGLVANSADSFAQHAGEIDARNVIARGEGNDVFASISQSSCGGNPCPSGAVRIGYSNFLTTFGLVDTGSVGHNQSTDPLLVNPVLGPTEDFHVACSGSPVIGAGTTDAANGPTDRDGVTHPAPPSIGAYEFVGTQACPTGVSGAGGGGGGGGTDTTAPDTKLGKHPKKKTKKRRAKFTFSSTEAGSSFQCKLDRKALKPCSSPKTVKVKPGKHTFQVAAVDAAGNQDGSPAKFSWKVLKP
jgi:hypothetical protein